MKATPTTYTWQEILELDAEACARLVGQGERHAQRLHAPRKPSASDRSRGRLPVSQTIHIRLIIHSPVRRVQFRRGSTGSSLILIKG